jgi:hypothetical protein
MNNQESLKIEEETEELTQMLMRQLKLKSEDEIRILRGDKIELSMHAPGLLPPKSKNFAYI